jgi:hypothetical protein
MLAVLLLVGCGAHAPRGSLLLGARHGPAVARASLQQWTRSGTGPGLEGIADHEQDARERARRLEEAQVEQLVLAAQREGRGSEADEAARAAELERLLSHVLGLAGGVEEVGAKLAFTLWVQRGALTLLDYRAERGSGRTGRPVVAEELSRLLRLVLSEYVGQRTGETVLKLRREETRWTVDYEATHHASRPPEAKTLPVLVRGTPAEAFISLHEASKEWVRTLQVAPGSATRVEFGVRLEDGRLAGWELLELQRTYERHGGTPRALPSQVTEAVSRVLLPFTEGVGPRSVRLVLRVEHPSGKTDVRGWVESARVERSAPEPELSWYRAMHEATLLRWREGVHEGSAWLTRKSVEELALWYVGGILARGAGFFATRGLTLVTKALRRSPEAAAGWLRTTLKRLPLKDRREFESLWSKVELEGEKALTQSERTTLRGLMERIEQLIQQPLGDSEKEKLRSEGRKLFKKLHPELASILDGSPWEYPIHHRRPLEYAQLFPDEDMNAAENLMLVQKPVHERINVLWTKLRAARDGVTARDVEDAARIIDRHLGPWCHRVDIPNELPSAFNEAEQAALKELQRRFPGLS